MEIVGSRLQDKPNGQKLSVIGEAIFYGIRLHKFIYRYR